MSDQISIKILGDNTCLRHSFLAHFGQSFLIEVDDKKILFDIGEFDQALVNNLEKFNVSIDDISDIVLSHAHFDHVAGLMQFVSRLSHQQLILSENLFQPELVQAQLKRYQVEMSIDPYLAYPHKTVLQDSLQLSPHLFTTGPLLGDIREQSLVIDLQERGIVVVAGCSHPGIETIIAKAKEITGNTKLYGLIGGFHFVDMDSLHIEEKVNFLLKENPEFIVPMHCTGLTASFALRQVFGDRVVMSEAGSIGVGNIIHLSPEFSIDMERRLGGEK